MFQFAARRYSLHFSLPNRCYGGSARFFSAVEKHVPAAAATAEADADAKETVSLRQRLKNMNPDMKLLQYLDEINAGYLNKRDQRVRVARRLNPTKSKAEKKKEGSAPPPAIKKEVKVFPFKKPGWLMGTSHSWTKDESLKLVDAPYVAVIGRSNVGKSSLVNTLVNYDFSFVQRAKVSNKPGETKELTFYGLGKLKEHIHNKKEGTTETVITPAMVLADLPGYGFAYMNDEHRQRCEDLTFHYFLHGQFDPQYPRNLKRILLLLDARHGMKAADKQFLKELSTKVEDYYKLIKKDLGKSVVKKLSWKIQLVLTKCDLVERMDLCRQMMLLKEDYAELVPPKLQSDLPIMPVSSYEKSGINALQHELGTLVPPLSPSTVSMDEETSTEKNKTDKVKKVDKKDKKAVTKEEKKDSTKGKDPKFIKRTKQYLDEDEDAGKKSTKNSTKKATKKESIERKDVSFDYEDFDEDKVAKGNRKERRARAKNDTDATKTKTKKTSSSKSDPAIEGRWDPKYQTMIFADEDEINDFYSENPRPIVVSKEKQDLTTKSKKNDKVADSRVRKGTEKPVSAKKMDSTTDKKKVSSKKSPVKKSYEAEDDFDDDDIVEGWDDVYDDEDDDIPAKKRSPKSKKQSLKDTKTPLKRSSRSTRKAVSMDDDDESEDEEEDVKASRRPVRRLSSMDEYAMSLFEKQEQTPSEGLSTVMDADAEKKPRRVAGGVTKRVTRGRKSSSAVTDDA